jgi:hypothetical protein
MLNNMLTMFKNANNGSCYDAAHKEACQRLQSLLLYSAQKVVVNSAELKAVLDVIVTLKGDLYI